MSITLDRPDSTDQTNNELGTTGNFPERLFVIELGGGTYAAIDATTHGPEPMKARGLVTCPTNEDCDAVKAAFPLFATGKPVEVSFEEARKIATSKRSLVAKLGLNCMLLLVQGVTVDLHWIG